MTILQLIRETDRLGDYELLEVVEPGPGQVKCDFCFTIYEGQYCPACLKADLLQQKGELEQTLVEVELIKDHIVVEIDGINERLKEIESARD